MAAQHQFPLGRRRAELHPDPWAQLRLGALALLLIAAGCSRSGTGQGSGSESTNPPSGQGLVDAGAPAAAEAGPAARGDAATDDAPSSRDDAGTARPDVDKRDPCDPWSERLELSRQLMANPGFGRQRMAAPIVLHHGMAGFRELGPLAYFGEAPSHLRRMGFVVYLTQVEPIAATADRAAELRQQLRCIARVSGASGLHVVGHSQGGLDARLVASSQGDEGLIRSVTTISSPHRGSAVASAFIDLTGDRRTVLLDAILGLYGSLAGRPDAEIDLVAQLGSFTREAMIEFNRQYPDHPAVTYRSWAGRSVATRLTMDRASALCDRGHYPNPEGRDVVDPLFALIHPIVSEREGPNDGLVSVEGAMWGQFMGCIPADHLDEVGLMADSPPQRFSGFHYLEFLERVAMDLATP